MRSGLCTYSFRFLTLTSLLRYCLSFALIFIRSFVRYYDDDEVREGACSLLGEFGAAGGGQSYS